MIVLERAYLPMGTFGTLYIPGGSLVTVECPWYDNQTSVSCIPEGRYRLERDTFKEQYDNFKLMNVPNRTDIEIHIANRASELRGCIAVGTEFTVVESEFGVGGSKVAMDVFMESMSVVGHDTIWIRTKEGGIL